MKFNSRVQEEFPLNKYMDKNALLKAIDNVKFVSGGTNTADAIKYTREKMFTAGSRDGF